MFVKMSFVVLGLLAVAVSATQFPHSYEEPKEDYYDVPHYAYEYKVHDPHTGDVKSAHESREGDVVKGYYSLQEADGTTREVHYTADKHNGFQAEVKKIGHGIHHEPPKHGLF